MPSEVKRYIHRVGRTARAGNVGRSITLIGEKDRVMLKNITKLQNDDRPLKQRTIDPGNIKKFNKFRKKLEKNFKNCLSV